MSQQTQVPQLTEEQFASFLVEKLDREHFGEAFRLFRLYAHGEPSPRRKHVAHGAELSFELVSALLQAADHGKVPEVLAELRRHWDEDLQFQPPDIRGSVGSLLAAPMSHTQITFKRIYEEIIGLKKEA